MESIVLTIHIILAIVIIALVLMQQGKGAGIGASFGSGSSGTVFGSRGSISFFAKITALCITSFFVTSLVLAWVAQRQYHGQASGVNELLQTIESNATNSSEETVILPTDTKELENLETLPNLQQSQNLPQNEQASDNPTTQ